MSASARPETGLQDGRSDCLAQQIVADLARPPMVSFKSAPTDASFTTAIHAPFVHHLFTTAYFVLRFGKGMSVAKPRFGESQILKFIEEVEAGASILELCRRRGFSTASFYNWRARYRARNTARELGVATAPCSTDSSAPIFRLWPEPAWADDDEQEYSATKIG